MITTPWQLSRRAELYHQLGSLLTAGIPVRRGIEMLVRNPPSGIFRSDLRKIQLSLDRGSTLTEAFESVGKSLPEFDVALISAGEMSGRLDQCLKLLSHYYSETASLMRFVIGNSIRTLINLHVALLIMPLSLLVAAALHGEWGALIAEKAIVFGVLYGAGFLLLFAGQGNHAEGWRLTIEKILSCVPMLGTARQSLALARLSAALEALINAGVLPAQAWTMAAAASGSPGIKRQVNSWLELLESGSTPAELVNQSDLFPEMFANLFQTGEQSGKQDESLLRLERHYREDGERKLKLFCGAANFGIYLLVLLGVAYGIVASYAPILNGVNSVLEP